MWTYQGCQRSREIDILIYSSLSFPGEVFLTSGFFQDFVFIFLIFYSLKLIGLGVVFWEFIPLDVFWASWICGFVCNIHLGEILSYYCFKYSCRSFFLFLSFGYSRYLFVAPFVGAPQSLDNLGFFQPLFSSLFSFGGFYEGFPLPYPQPQKFFPQLYPVY